MSAIATEERPTVADVMTPHPICIGRGNAIRTAIELMRAGGFRRLPVVEGERLIGIVTESDLRRAANTPASVTEYWYDDPFILDHIPVAACMTPHPITVTPATPLTAAARILRDRKIGGLPVVAGGRLVGIITATDLLNYLIRCLETNETLRRQTAGVPALN